MVLQLKKDPSSLILNSNNEFAILHFLKILDLQDSCTAIKSLSNLLKTQLSDGSFPSEFDSNVGGIKSTCRLAHLLLDYGYSSKSLVINSALEFLLLYQNSDGGWSENPNIKIPEEVMELRTDKSITWLTADIIELLHRVEKGGSDACENARLWLIKMQKQDGGWTMWDKEKQGSDPDSSAQILFMLKDYYGSECFSWKQGLDIFEKFLDEREQEAKQGYYFDPLTKEKKVNDIYTLSHLLLSSLTDKERRINTGYNMNDSRVRNIVKEIINIQKEDGGWNPFWKEESDTTYSVLATKLLVLLNVLDVIEIKKQIKNLI